jgi:hypothetical protein
MLCSEFLKFPPSLHYIFVFVLFEVRVDVFHRNLVERTLNCWGSICGSEQRIRSVELLVRLLKNGSILFEHVVADGRASCPSALDGTDVEGPAKLGGTKSDSALRAMRALATVYAVLVVAMISL